MKEAITPIFNALPWLNSLSSAGSKESSLRPSRPAAKMIAGLVQDPKSRAARAFLAEAAALQAASWVLQSPTVSPERLPELTALAHALFWTWNSLVTYLKTG